MVETETFTCFWVYFICCCFHLVWFVGCLCCVTPPQGGGGGRTLIPPFKALGPGQGTLLVVLFQLELEVWVIIRLCVCRCHWLVSAYRCYTSFSPLSRMSKRSVLLILELQLQERDQNQPVELLSRHCVSHRGSMTNKHLQTHTHAD